MPKHTETPLGTVFIGRVMMINERTKDVTAFTVWAYSMDEMPKALAEVSAEVARRGYRPMTRKEFRDTAEAMMEAEGKKLAVEAAAGVMKGSMVDPETLDRMLKMHKGREGGDA